MSNLKDLRYGYDTALCKALELVESEGVEALRKEVAIRKAKKYTGPYMVKELDVVVEQVYHDEVAAMMLIVMAALKDLYGFGLERQKKLLAKVIDGTAYILQGWATLDDYNQSLREALNDEIVDAIYHSKTRLLPHPLPEDCYDEKDLVSEKEWKWLMESIGFTEQKNPNGKDCWDIYDQAGNHCFQYEGQWEKIRAYDILEGALWGKQHDWSKPEIKKPSPPVPKPVRNRRKKKR